MLTPSWSQRRRCRLLDPRAPMQAVDAAINAFAVKAATFVVEGVSLAQSSIADLNPLRTLLAGVEAARVAVFAALDATRSLTLDPAITLARYRDQSIPSASIVR